MALRPFHFNFSVETPFEELARCSRLTPKETHVLRALHGIDHGPMQLRDVAKIFGVTHQAIQQTEKIVLRKLRWLMRDAA